MRIHYFGHATCSLTAADGTCLLIDPYESGAFGGRFRYPPILGTFHAVTATHDHIDHHALHTVDAPYIHEGQTGPFEIKRFPLAHDEYDGKRRGGYTDALMIQVDNLCVVHLGDCGQSPEGLTPLRGCDVLFVPVGGFYTIGAFQAWEWVRRIQPRVAIPIHYKTPECDLPIRTLETFLALAREYNRAPESYIDVEVSAHLPRVVVIPHGP